MRWIVVAAFAAAAAACQTSPAPTTTTAAAGTSRAVPPDYRAQIIGWVRSNVFDPYSIRDASISEPTQGFVADMVIGGVRPYVCTEYNAKNRFGAYVGLTQTVFTFTNGRLVGGVVAPGMCYDGVYSPFPELEAIE